MFYLLKTLPKFCPGFNLLIIHSGRKTQVQYPRLSAKLKIMKIHSDLANLFTCPLPTESISIGIVICNTGPVFTWYPINAKSFSIAQHVHIKPII